jgi:hypothetical protein
VPPSTTKETEFATVFRNVPGVPEPRPELTLERQFELGRWGAAPRGQWRRRETEPLLGALTRIFVKSVHALHAKRAGARSMP